MQDMSQHWSETCSVMCQQNVPQFNEIIQQPRASSSPQCLQQLRHWHCTGSQRLWPMKAQAQSVRAGAGIRQSRTVPVSIDSRRRYPGPGWA
ncbi:hypothetical protein WMY93_017931 [Mugilogobius chulae]|uniref:Uncharacterized protein n=1 Tax=Mugilogobius chulae TaxID=88201 RepID=A0AAW0NTD5_9GOBI